MEYIYNTCDFELYDINGLEENDNYDYKFINFIY